ncbi:MAG TPA: dialkylresorcinol condensing enzyme DarA [Flavobacterium sp.]
MASVKNILVVYYSQSGQLREIADHLTAPLLKSTEVNLEFYCIEPDKPFPFPWTKQSFFDVFPETFRQIPVALTKSTAEAKKYDLVLLFYQVWYLSPSIPINSFLQSEFAKSILSETPVVTISGSRNMWIMAQEKVKVLLNDNNAKLVGNIALTDRAPNLISVITIVDWMFSGLKKKYLGIFPLPGVAQADIVGASRFGNVILEELLLDNLNNLQPKLVAKGAVKISSYLVRVDKTGNKIFAKWSNLILNRPSARKNLLKAFYVYLFLAIWLVSPIVYILHLLLYPLNYQKIKIQSLYYKGI